MLIKKRLNLSRSLVMGISAFVMACSSLHTIDMSEDQLQQRIRAGDFITEGDRLQIITSDEKRHEIWVTSVDETFIRGEKSVRSEKQVHGKRSVEREDVGIPIDNIVTVKTRDFSAGKTTLLSGSLIYLMMLIAAASAAAFL